MCGPKSRCRKERVMERHDNMIPKLYQLVKQLKSAPSYVADHLIVSFGQVSDAFVTVSLSGMWGIMKNDLETLPSSCAMWKKLPETTLQTTVSAFDQVESIERLLEGGCLHVASIINKAVEKFERENINYFH